jgi:carboxypeptidase C (cathepsin A)
MLVIDGERRFLACILFLYRPGSIYCNSAMIQPFQKTGLNIYDIRKRCDEGNPLCYDIINDIETWANLPEVQDALGVDVQFKGCNMDVNRNFLFAGDWSILFLYSAAIRQLCSTFA